nr:mucin-2-like [Paramormyrops kingsleyae]XP_023670985.1 mucin-2-like [Paramormyrops kingsleyae]XP_023670986.1 mucin-2-like [Paramormyrops kingsleyae]XP_023670988.1 mucin-2-like [Paramormyrops kingsleyae]XP_023670989.1 mucin-2-like [Paramormyrops kingsleyae]
MWAVAGTHAATPSWSVKMGVGLVFSLALLWSSSSATTKQCFSKERTNLIINASAAFLARTTVLDARTSLSQQACLLDCCSQEVFKCNWAVYRPDKPSGSENCYLFYCEREEDCPLIPMNGVNSYNIFTGVDYPSMNHLTTTKAATQPSTTPRVTIRVTAKPTYVTTPSTPTATTHTSTAVTTPTQPVTTTQPTTTTITTLPPTITQPSISTTLPSITSTEPSITTTTTTTTTTVTTSTQPASSRQTTTTIQPASTTQQLPATTRTPQPSSTTAHTQPTTTLTSSQPTTTTTESATTALIITPPTFILHTDPITMKTTTTSSLVARPNRPIDVSMQKTITASALTTTVQSPLTTEIKIGTDPTETTAAETTCVTWQALLATTITTTATPKTETQTSLSTSTTKPNKNIKNHNKPTKKQAMKPSPYNTRLGTTTTTTIFPSKHHLKLTTANAKQSSVTRPPGLPHKAASRKPKTNLRTSATTIKAKVSTAQMTTWTTATPTLLMTQRSAASMTPLQVTAKEAKSMLVAPPPPAPPTTKPGHTNPPKRNTVHQRTLKSTLEVAVVVGLVFLALVIALVGRKAMESFNRRQYTRLELNDLYYDV